MDRSEMDAKIASEMDAKIALFTEWWDAYRASTTRFVDLDIAVEWIRLRMPAIEAAAWARAGYLPAEAAPLIAQGITPQMARAADQAAVAADGGRDAHLRAEVLRLAEQGLIIDPDLADRLGLDQPEADQR